MASHLRRAARARMLRAATVAISAVSRYIAARLTDDELMALADATREPRLPSAEAQKEYLRWAVANHWTPQQRCDFVVAFEIADKLRDREAGQ